MATSVKDKIDTIKTRISDAYASLSNKGATIPSSKTSANLKATVDSIKVADVIYDSNTKTLRITIV